MIQISLSPEKQKRCEEFFLKVMENILPFYTFEIYGCSNENEIKESIKQMEKEEKEERKQKIKDTRKLLWKKYEALYRYLYLPKKDSAYPVSGREAEKKNVFSDRLRRLLVGPKGKMKQGTRRERLKEIIDELGMIKRNEDLDGIFPYEAFARSGEAKQFLKILEIEVCPYCNSAFTSTVLKGELGQGKAGIRPQFDHYFPKDKYPYYAVNLYNLIPSCGKCNQYKSEHNTYEKPMLYPYDEGLGKEYVFKTYPRNGSMQYLRGKMLKEDFVLRIEPDLRQIYENENRNPEERREFEKRIAESVKILHLEEVYMAHTGFASDILRNRYIFSEQYIELLKKRFPTMDFTMQDVKKILYGRDIEMENWGKNILAKLTDDMEREIKE